MNLSEINWDLESAGTWPPLVKGIVTLIISLIVSGIWFNFDIKEQLSLLEVEANKESSLKKEFEDKQKKAINLQAYVEQLAEMEETFGTMLKQLPNGTEVANLLVDVSQTGLASGLEFELFKPKSEVKKDFYAELPIDVRVTGSFIELGGFVSGLAALSRIVTVHDINISGYDDSRKMVMTASVKTYRYLDEGELEDIAKSKAESKKKKRRR